jgi:outer membrane lipoprotein LolB
LKQTVLRTSLCLFSVLLLLNACTGVSVKESDSGNNEAYRNRAEKLAAISEWGFVGRISLDDGEQGGSGKLRWDVQADHSELDFHGAMGRGAWNLTIDPDRAVLREANGMEQTAADVNEVVQDRMGWLLPVDALQWWVRGLAAPGAIEDEQFDSEGLLVSLNQFGWSVDFSRYDSRDVLALPIRLNATRDNYRVKLAISRWHTGVERDRAD